MDKMFLSFWEVEVHSQLILQTFIAQKNCYHFFFRKLALSDQLANRRFQQNGVPFLVSWVQHYVAIVGKERFVDVFVFLAYLTQHIMDSLLKSHS